MSTDDKFLEWLDEEIEQCREWLKDSKNHEWSLLSARNVALREVRVKYLELKNELQRQD